jgi:hypothetical protein
LITPLGLSPISHTLGLGLQHLALLLRFAVDAVKGDDLQSLVQQTWVLIFRGCEREGDEEVSELL